MSKEDNKQSLGSKLTQKTAPFFEKVGSLSRLQRILISVVTLCVIGGCYYYFLLMPRQQQITNLNNQLTSLQAQLAGFKSKAASLKKYETLMAEAQASFLLALETLPDKKEIPSLLTGISRSGNSAGLEFVLFQPESAAQQQYYAEIPVSIKVTGSFHKIASFFDLVSRLYRIVNINDITMTSSKDSLDLAMSCKAVTYMFVDKEEPQKGKKANK